LRIRFFMKKILFTIALGAIQALASPINIFNTGSVVSLGMDQNWTIDGGNAYVTDTSGFPFIAAAWLGDDATSSFISPQPSYTGSATDTPDTVFKFDTTFNLPSYAVAFLDLRFLVDNHVNTVLLNGHDLGISYASATGGDTFNVWSPTYTVNRYFQAGTNTLELQVYNAGGTTGNPAGLRVEFLDSFVGVPEPGTLASLAGGIGLIALFLRRKRHPAA
jgi:hypothetical protein